MDQATAEYWMREAMEEARQAEAKGEVPVGAILLINEKVVGRGHNQSIETHDPTAHAEIVALRQAARTMQNYRLPGSIMVVTVEPCAMCVGAMIHARVEEIYYGAADPKAGAVHSHFQLAGATELNHTIGANPGILEQECRSLLREFFQSRRKGPSD